jgi:2-polyprenyl-6-methoxyphenol hydroxylase-like FAD-dependent oxidoreductase
MSLALFLHERGIRARIIDKKKEISPYSKALGINPRTLEILEPYGITKRFLENGRKMLAANIWKGDKLIVKNELSKVGHRYPFLLIQPQRETELILLEELAGRGIHVEYETQFMGFEKKEDGYRSVLQGEDVTHFDSDYIVGADGAHSDIRKQLNIPFEGFRYKETWELYDAELETQLPADEANILTFREGGMILMRIKENVWRVAGNLPGLLQHLPQTTRPGKISWSTRFTISHQVARTLVKDRIALIGDAAHVHSPIGGRGMNLGIEDAFLLSGLIAEGRVGAYEKLRHRYLRSTVKRVNTLTQFITGHSFLHRTVRNNLGLLKPFFPLGLPRARKFLLGLDRAL